MNVIIVFIVPANVSLFPETVIAPEPNTTESFSCKAFGIPLPNIVWKRLDRDFDIHVENTSIIESSMVMDSGMEVALSMLTFNEFSDTTEGIYECHGFNNVTNFIGVSSFAYGEFLLAGKRKKVPMLVLLSLLLIFYSQAMPSIESPEGVNITGLEGGSINFNFEITYAVPDVETNDIIWKFTSIYYTGFTINLENEERVQFEDDLLNITIYNITKDDAGIYNITATNRAGTGYASIELIVEGMIYVKTDC